jgi:hypothetical protein
MYSNDFTSEPPSTDLSYPPSQERLLPGQPPLILLDLAFSIQCPGNLLHDSFSIAIQDCSSLLSTATLYQYSGMAT